MLNFINGHGQENTFKTIMTYYYSPTSMAKQKF